MNDYSSLFTSGLMLLCDSAKPRSRQPSPDLTSCQEPARRGSLPMGLRSFLSLDVAESLRTLATGSSSSPASSRAHSRKPSTERRTRIAPSPAASSSKLVTSTAVRTRATASPASSRRRSLPQPKPAPLAQLPVLPGAPSTHSRSRSDSATSSVVPSFGGAPSRSSSDTLPEACGGMSSSRRHLAPITSSLKLELSSAPTTPGSRFPTTPTSMRAFSMFSPLTPPSSDYIPWTSNDPISPSETWNEAFASALSPGFTESALGLRFTHASALTIVHEGENVAPQTEDRTSTPKRARARRDRHSAPSRSASITATSMRSSQASVTTAYRRNQRSGALARLEGKIPRSEWMSDDEEGAPAKFKPSLSLMPSTGVNGDSHPTVIPTSVRKQLGPPRTEDQNFSFIDLTDDAASLAARRGVRSFAI